MFACQAYLEARSIDDPMPTWVMNYLDGAMSSSWRSFQAFRTRNDQKLNRPNLAFAEAFQIKTIPIGERRGRSGEERFGRATLTQPGSASEELCN